MGHTGTQYTFLIGKETTWGTIAPAGADIDVGIVQNVTTTPTREHVESRGIGSIEANSNETAIKDCTQAVELQYQHGRLFDFIVGEATHDNSGTDYEHTFTVDDQPKSYSSHSGSNISGGDVGWSALGNIVESAELSVELNGILKLNVTSKCKFPTKITTVSSHSVSTLPVFPHRLCSVELNTVAASQVQNFKVRFEKTVEPVDGLGADDHQGMVASEFRVSFSGTLAFDDDTYHAHMENNDLTAVEFLADNGTAYGSGKRALELALNDIELTSFNEVGTFSGIVLLEIEGVGKINTFKTYDNITDVLWLPTS